MLISSICALFRLPSRHVSCHAPVLQHSALSRFGKSLNQNKEYDSSLLPTGEQGRYIRTENRSDVAKLRLPALRNATFGIISRSVVYCRSTGKFARSRGSYGRAYRLTDYETVTASDLVERDFSNATTFAGAGSLHGKHARVPNRKPQFLPLGFFIPPAGSGGACRR
jgi:hypothetical protein